MAPRTRTSITWRSQQFSALLSSAILEWVLMLLLLLEGLLSYLVTTFARICKLQPPCLMCTRLDHVLGDAHPGFYRNLMCNSHKAEASSWAFCHIHQKLIDVHSMCEVCLLSFATDNKSNLETYRLLMGKLGVGIGDAGCGHDFSLSSASEAQVVMKEDTLCSCCSRPLKIRSYPFVVLQGNDSGIDTGEVCRDVSRDQCTDEINHVVYSELKTSDTESEPQHRGGNVRSSMEKDATATDNSKEDFTLGNAQTNIADGNAHEKVANNSKLTQVQNGVSDKEHSEDSRELRNIQSNVNANLQSTDLPRQDKPEDDDVWHNALGSIEQSPGVDNDHKSAETNAAPNEMKPEFSDRTTLKDSFRVHQDLKLLLSQLSTSQAPDSSTSFVVVDTPSVQEQHERAILHNISRALSLERNYSDVSENTVNLEAEGDCSTIDHLKQQVELDRKSMSLLWKELEEERNASAVAANQTMAMITRLQEEKAAMQMEALQYRRVMEEQCEYDREDLKKMADTVRSLEAEIESYKTKLRDQSIVGEIRDQMRLSCPKEGDPGNSRSFHGFEDENAYISRQLRKLKNQLHRFSNDGQFIQEPKVTDEEDEDMDDVCDDDCAADDEGEETAGNSVVGRRVRNGNNFKYLAARGGDDPEASESGVASFGDEISELSGRLQALEADRSFLEHSVNSLKNGREGESVIHDIACSLRELRKTGITWKEYD